MRKTEYEIMYREENSHWWYVSLHELILEYVPQNNPGQRILDAGCGTGRLLQLLQSRGAAAGCDASDLALHYCAKRGVSAFKYDLSSCSLEPAGFDVITSIDVLYHRGVLDDEAVLRNMYGALKPGGRLILQVPAYEWLRSSHDDAVHTGRRYTRERVIRMLKACGFIVEKATYRVTLLFIPIALVRLARRTVRLNRANPDGASDVKKHSALINALLLVVMKAENRLLKNISVPFGASVFVVGRKPDSSGESRLR